MPLSRPELQHALRTERAKLLEPDMVEDEPDVTSAVERHNDIHVGVFTNPSAINNGYCKIYAQRVTRRLNNPPDLTISNDDITHTWLEHDGLCYDVECIDGVEHPSMLPVYNR